MHQFMINLRHPLNRLRRSLILIGLISLIELIGLTGLIAPASASILRTADASGAIVVQSRRTLRDQNRQSWQVIAFKPVHPDRPNQSIALRLVGFPERTKIAHPSPIALIDFQAQTWTVADRSDQISADLNLLANTGQYDLQSVLPHLPTQQRLRLEVPTLEQETLVLKIPPALIAEWQQVAASEASQLVEQCKQFPLEARRNPAFPAWTSCQL
jgi:hypothetical protein